MKNSTPFLVTFLTAFLPCFSAFSQTIFNPYFQNLEQKTCPFDTSKTVVWPKGWEIFQTQNGDWNGPIDSTHCISAKKIVGSSFGAQVDLSQIDPKKPIFMRGQRDLSFVLMEPNTAYSLRMNFLTSPNAVWKSGIDCENELCTGLAIEIAIPDSFGNAFSAIRSQAVSAPLPPPAAPNGCFYSDAQGCVPTEYFAEQLLEKVILKWTFDDSAATITPTDFLQVNSVELHGNQFDTGVLMDFSWPDAAQTPIEIPIYEVAQFPSGGFGGSILGLFDPSDGYPTKETPSFIEANLLPNPTEQKTISLRIEPPFTFIPQPFTYLHGAFVVGSDSIRHILELINDGGNLCLTVVDLVFGGPSKYVHNGGNIELNNAFSCLQFQRDSEMRIKKGQTLYYGNAGTGMLQICSGSKVVLEPSSRLVVDCILGLGECGDPTRPSRTEVVLEAGSELVFTKNASLFNQYSENKALRLSVKMLGGRIDDEALSPEDRLKIERIWPEPDVDFSKNATVRPTLFLDEIEIETTTNAAGFLNLELFDALGQLVFSTKKATEKGLQKINIALPELLSSGAFFLVLENEKGERAAKKLMKMSF